VRIASQLLDASDLRILGAQIDEEVAHDHVVVTSAGRSKRGAQRLDSACEGWCQRMLEWRAAPALHDEILDWGRMHCAAARAY
jgi:hypothetical protein